MPGWCVYRKDGGEVLSYHTADPGMMPPELGVRVLADNEGFVLPTDPPGSPVRFGRQPGDRAHFCDGPVFRPATDAELAAWPDAERRDDARVHKRRRRADVQRSGGAGDIMSRALVRMLVTRLRATAWAGVPPPTVDTVMGWLLDEVDAD